MSFEHKKAPNSGDEAVLSTHNRQLREIKLILNCFFKHFVYSRWTVSEKSRIWEMHLPFFMKGNRKSEWGSVNGVGSVMVWILQNWCNYDYRHRKSPYILTIYPLSTYIYIAVPLLAQGWSQMLNCWPVSARSLLILKDFDTNTGSTWKILPLYFVLWAVRPLMSHVMVRLAKTHTHTRFTHTDLLGSHSFSCEHFTNRQSTVWKCNCAVLTVFWGNEISA